eukprot:Hpha_TRINITY_DN16499_c0_g10::TRINITY_DN16499_c0_g10_i1::g.159315::m.159315/K03514/PAPD5_7, TRF4; non-canonical poly(A) RNA polymerase PAPD5/7
MAVQFDDDMRVCCSLSSLTEICSDSGGESNGLTGSWDSCGSRALAAVRAISRSPSPSPSPTREGTDATPTLADAILDLPARWVLTPAAREQRQVLQEKVQRAVDEVWPGRTVQLYGSLATGLAGPDSAVDLVLEGVDCQKAGALLPHLAARRLRVLRLVQLSDEVPATVLRARCGHSGVVMNLILQAAEGVSLGRRSAKALRQRLEEDQRVAPVTRVLQSLLLGEGGGLHQALSGGMAVHATAALVLSCASKLPGADAGELMVEVLQQSGSWPSSSGSVHIPDPEDDSLNVAGGCTRWPEVRWCWVKGLEAMVAAIARGTSAGPDLLTAFLSSTAP